MNDLDETLLDCVVQETGPDPRHTILWLHGLGADGHDFAPIVPQLRSATRRPVRFVFPHAPVRPVTINNGVRMRAWYDILGVDIARDEDRAGIAESLEHIQRLIDRERDGGTPPERIVLAGFSQGGAIALRAGLAQLDGLAGVVALSCYLLDGAGLRQWMTPAGLETPVFMGHGQQDPIVPVELGARSAEALESAGVDVRWQTWPMPHAVSPDEIAALDAWLDDCLDKRLDKRQEARLGGADE